MESVNENTVQIFLDQNIRYLRKSKNWSQEELASKVGLNRGNIASYEKGTAEPKLCNLLKIAHVFSISMFDLTRKDLRKEEYMLAHQQFTHLKSLGPNLHERIEEYQEQVIELETVVNSLYNCHCFKVKKEEELPKSAQAFANHFEQLHEVTRELLQAHRELMTLVSNECKGTHPNGNGQSGVA